MLQELRRFREEKCIEGHPKHLCFVRIYMERRDNDTFRRKLLRTYQYGEDAYPWAVFEDLAMILVHLLEIEPSLEKEMPQTREKYIRGALEILKGNISKVEAERFLNIVGKLLDENHWI